MIGGKAASVVLGKNGTSRVTIGGKTTILSKAETKAILESNGKVNHNTGLHENINAKTPTTSRLPKDAKVNAEGNIVFPDGRVYPRNTEFDSKGHVISREPKTLQDQMVLDAAKRGRGKKLDNIGKLNDPKYPNHDKWEYKEKSNEGVTSSVHYARDRDTGKMTDFKFKSHGDETGTDKQIPQYEKQRREQGGIVQPKVKDYSKRINKEK